jgi:hypothetical protein
MEKMHIMQEDDPVFARSAPLTVGSVSRALADSKEALTNAHALDQRVDDVDELIDSAIKSLGEHAKCLTSDLPSSTPRWPN